MDDCHITPSPQLLQANRRLYALREQVQAARRLAAKRQDDDLPWDSPVPEQPQASVADQVAALPSHLGWESQAVTAVLRRRLAQSGTDRSTDNQAWVSQLRETAVSSGHHSAQTTPPTATDVVQPLPGWVKLYPDIGLGMLRQELAAPGRLWLMLRYLDRQGSGNLRIDVIRETITTRKKPLYLCGRRQLRNLLRHGEGIFWTRDKERVWLYSAARVAFALGVARLTGRPVALPIAALLNGVGQFRAHLYTAFYSSRTRNSSRGSQAMPIARSTMAALSGVGASSQRTYEAQTGVKVQANFAVGEQITKENLENRAWQQGRALFEIQDYRGYQGQKGKRYLAWQLPNSYIGQHPHRPKGRQKRINRKLKDLVMKGMPGNVEGMNETQLRQKIYFPNGKLAAKAYSRNPKQELYWKRQRTRNGRFVLWQQLGGD